MSLHPSCRRFLDEDPIVAAWRDISSMTIEKARGLRAAGTVVAADVRASEDLEIPGPDGPIPARVYRPAIEHPSGVLVWFHGGGWVIGTLDMADAECRALAEASDALVVSVGYRLAPEHRFPAGVDDCFAATAWVAANRERLGVAGARLAVGGESAGGQLAAAVTMRARDEDGPAIALQLLVCAVTCRPPDGLASRTELGGSHHPNELALQWCWDQYLASPEQSEHPLASPLLAPSLEGLPPALVVSCEYDPLRDEAERYGERLSAAGVPAEVRRVAGAIHGLFAWSAEVPSVAAEVRHVGAVLRESLSAITASR